MNKIASKPTVLGQIAGPESCEMCGSPGLKTELVLNPFIYGVGVDAVELSAEIPVHTCATCDVSFTDEAAENIQHDAVCRHLGVLTPDEIRALRSRYGLSRAAFARLTGFGEATLARWERRDVIQNASCDRYLRLLQNTANVDRLRALTGLDTSTAGRRMVGARATVRFVHLSVERQRTYRRNAAGWRPRGVAA